ncbi:hypothetical protein GCM10009868_00230 [Terrabacter aerolatus]|uniref:Uncharacterized protein n=1 Tax=Terrabacter aerolatus TaxID=422442 RepID=A0A512D314_9MICO|nr:hypothetical protein [Terrabacter aerolatus]GEO30859.1 hypothetical protein TAE01_26690 [Terrabacter aerolatus]
MSVRFNAPPGWPVPSASWVPDDDWMPDPSWPTPPRGWTFWLVEQPSRPDAGTAGTPRFGTAPRSTAATYASPQTSLQTSAQVAEPVSGAASYGTDRGSWLAGLRARAGADSLVAATSPGPVAEPARQRAGAESAWELDGLLASAGRLDL